MTWKAIYLAPESRDNSWEFFHENSKVGRYDGFLPQGVILKEMEQLLESLPFDQYPAVDLSGALTPLNLPLGEAIMSRGTARHMRPCSLTLGDVATVLYYAYGVNRDNKATIFPRPFRTVPSGGALYPLEILLHSKHIQGLRAGLYHYNPTANNLRLLREGDASRRISEALIQPNLAHDTSLIFFLTAMFERSTFKYGARGYRFVLLEAGHVAQNINLVSNALGLGSINVGGYFDRQIDDLLELDGLTHSTIYLIGIGEKLEDPQDPAELL
ncbi:MAG TPA: SagB/ThcOx family dehydrogenase [Candidatus Tectomicrobia bacterium]|nr:SagB/ThcOx family dehydrogenase [Candidatus Tectomicrobia bacterium]